MSDRIHDSLDGEIPRSSLTPRESRDVDELEELVEESLAFVREAPVPDVAPSVMGRIRQMEREERKERKAEAEAGGRGIVGVLEELVAWLWTPRPVNLRPAWAFAALAAVALGIGTVSLPTGDSSGGVSGLASGSASGSAGVDGRAGAAAAAGVAESTRGSGAVEPVLYVRFELAASGASSVSLAGTFTDWQPRYQLAETESGRWTAYVALQPGVHDYAFVVDGERWVADPHAIAVNDGFGGVNSRVALLAPEPVGNGQNGRTS